MIDGGVSRRHSQLKVRLYKVLAISLCTLAVSGVILKGREAATALSWGWEDITSPVTSEFKHGKQVNFGVYDLHEQFSNAKGVAIEHIFVSWLSSDLSDTIRTSFQYANERNRWLMITVEPDAATDRKSQLLDDVIAGAYDSKIASLCQSIGSLQSPMLIRWGHEMEIADKRYPWSGASGENYIAAYRHFAEKCRADAPKIFLVWSPRGESVLTKYYPGAEYVDLIGVSLYELPAYDLDNFGRVFNFQEAFTPRYRRVVAFGKEVIIAEMGVSGEQNYQLSWMAGFFRNLRLFPRLRTAVYFNAKDNAGAWPEKYGVPDWRIDPKVFE